MNSTTLTDTERRLAEALAARSVLPLEGVELMTDVARIFGVTGAELVGDRRTQKLTDARAVIAHILIVRGWTTAQVGELLNRNHSTAHHLAKNIEKDPELRLLVRELAAA